MDWLFPAILSSFVVGAWVAWAAFVYSSAKTGRALTRAFAGAARRLGLSPAGTSALRGRVRDVDVSVSVGDPNSNVGSPSPKLVLRAWAPGMPPAEVFSLVHPLLGLGSFEAIPGGLSRTHSALPRTDDELVAQIEDLVAAVEKAAAAPFAEHLLANLAAGSASDLRLKSMQALLAHYPKAEETARALDSCMADHDPEIRYLAGQETNPAALEPLLVDSKAAPELRVRVLETLQAKVPRERLSALVGKVLDHPCDGPQAAALRIVISRRDQAHVDRICAMSVSTPSAPAVAEGLAEALLALGVRSEPAMIGLLASGSQAAQGIAVKELREWGTVKSVEPLLLVTGPGSLEEAARGAARAIQSRLAGAEAGGVSVVEDVPSGGISLVREREKV